MAGVYVKLDANYDDDPAIIQAGEKAELLFVRGLALAKRTLSDGFVSDVQLPRFGLSSVQKRAETLVRCGLWARDDDKQGYWIRGWGKWNKSRSEVEEIREKRQKAGSKGGKASGQARREANAKQSASANGKQPANPEGEVEAKVEGEVEPPSPPSGAPSRGSRLSDDWRPEPEPELVKAIGGQAAAKREWAKFGDYWRAQPGAKGRKVDWQATWRNWLRRAAESLPDQPLVRPPPVEDTEDRRAEDEARFRALTGEVKAS